MSFKPYPKYKESGVEWLGRVPEHWELRRLGFHFDERREKVSDKDYPPLSVTKNGIVPQLETAAKTDDGDNRKLVRAGDFVINSRSDRKGSAGVAEAEGSVSLICTVLSPRPSASPSYVHHLLRSVGFQEEYYRYGKGIVADLWSTNFGEMRNILLAMPSVSEQASIASFLDQETAKIDALIAEQQRLIELLQEKRQAVISHAVTKGLNPDAPMKDSRIEWLGEVPEHWEVRRVRTVSSFTTSGPRGWSGRVGEVGSLFVQSGDLDDAMGVDFANCKRVQVDADAAAEAVRTQLRNGDVVACVTGAKTGNVAVCSTVPEVSYVNQHVCLIRPTEHVRPQFLGMLLKSGFGQTYFSLAQYGLKQGLSLEDIREAPVLLPPLADQQAVIDFVGEQTSRSVALVDQAERSIALHQERRSALISAAVTGQIDVRGFAGGSEAA